jgi:hypothetical protein
MRRWGIAVMAVAAIAGCGGSKPEDAVRATLQGYAKAFAAHDYQAICDRYLAPKLVDGVEQRGLPCEAAVRPAIAAAEKPVLAIRSIAVKDDAATAQVHTTAANQPPSDDTISLARLKGTWYIAGMVTAGPQPVAP